MTSSIGSVVSLAARAGGSVVRQVQSAIDPSAARPAGEGQPASGWLAVDPAPHGKRSATPGGVLLEAWTKVAPEAGVR